MAIFGTKTPSVAKAMEDKKEKTESAVKADASKKTAAINIPTVLIMPRISEKAGKLAALNKYVFKVKTNANKVEIKKAIESNYKVKVVQVNIINNQGKLRNFGQRSGKTQALKKAIVTLKKGDKIEGLMDVV